MNLIKIYLYPTIPLDIKIPTRLLTKIVDFNYKKCIDGICFHEYRLTVDLLETLLKEEELDEEEISTIKKLLTYFKQYPHSHIIIDYCFGFEDE